VTGRLNLFTWLRKRYHASSAGMRVAIVGGVFVVVAGVTTAVIGGMFALKAADIQSDGSSNRSEKVRLPADITELSQLQPCHDLPTDSPLAMQLRARGQAIIDGRCDSKPATPVGAYPATNRDSAAVTSLDTGYILENICLQSGDVIQDMVESKSSTWVRFQLDPRRQAFVAAIWVQGEDDGQPC